jgi:hypothetical protein
VYVCVYVCVCVCVCVNMCICPGSFEYWNLEVRVNSGRGSTVAKLR